MQPQHSKGHASIGKVNTKNLSAGELNGEDILIFFCPFCKMSSHVRVLRLKEEIQQCTNTTEDKCTHFSSSIVKTRILILAVRPFQKCQLQRCLLVAGTYGLAVHHSNPTFGACGWNTKGFPNPWRLCWSLKEIIKKSLLSTSAHEI